jgi:hypothetical protein
MSHKKYLNHLRQHDPILYYEMTGDPTHSNSDNDSGYIIIFLFLFVVFFFAGVAVGVMIYPVV